MITPSTQEVPSDAIPCFFAAANGHKGTYWIWKREEPLGGGKFYWYALKNTGWEASEQAAKEAAKRWIRDGH